MPIINNLNQIKLSPWVKKIYCEGDVVYSSGNIVTYYIDSGISFQEEVDEGESCLSPATFTPAKSGWEFVGWRQDTSASSSVLDSLVMGDEPVTLYAVFSQTVTLSYNANGGSGSTAAQTGTRYYNTGNYSNPSFALRSNGFSRSNYNFNKWAMGSAGGTQYSVGASVTLSANTTMYAIWTYVGNPYYIAINQKSTQYVYWTYMNKNNVYEGDGWAWYANSQSRIGVSAEDGGYVSCTMQSSSLETKGNRTVTIKLFEILNGPGGYGGNTKITINGTSKYIGVGGTQQWDVSNVSSFTIAVDLGHDDNAHVGFESIYLS